jgi:hypothetical protein
MEQSALKIVNNYLTTNIYSYLETDLVVKVHNLDLNVVHVFNTSLNEGESAASFCQQVASLFPDMFCNFYL